MWAKLGATFSQRSRCSLVVLYQDQTMIRCGPAPDLQRDICCGDSDPPSCAISFIYKCGASSCDEICLSIFGFSRLQLSESFLLTPYLSPGDMSADNPIQDCPLASSIPSESRTDGQVKVPHCSVTGYANGAMLSTIQL